VGKLAIYAVLFLGLAGCTGQPGTLTVTTPGPFVPMQTLNRVELDTK